jgi:hypothetical protein
MTSNFSKGCTLGAEVKDPAVGLCSDCQHCRIVKSQRSTFYMCRLSLTNPEYRKYPPLPVLRCAGYLPSVPGGVDGAPDDKLRK